MNETRFSSSLLAELMFSSPKLRRCQGFVPSFQRDRSNPSSVGGKTANKQKTKPIFIQIIRTNSKEQTKLCVYKICVPAACNALSCWFWVSRGVFSLTGLDPLSAGLIFCNQQINLSTFTHSFGTVCYCIHNSRS